MRAKTPTVAQFTTLLAADTNWAATTCS